MCLIVFAYKQRDDFPLILAANRDEYYRRPSATLAFWKDVPHILAGRDLLKGGTWLGVTRDGHLAAVTNYRDTAHRLPESRSRGLLVSDYLRRLDSAPLYLKSLQSEAHEYSGFNLLAGDHQELYYFSNCQGKVLHLEPGIYALSNRFLNTPWPKVGRVKQLFTAEMNRRTPRLESIFDILADQNQPADECLPDTGVGLEWERILAPIFISSSDYGTCSSTVLMFSKHRIISMFERAHGNGPDQPTTTEYTFERSVS